MIIRIVPVSFSAMELVKVVFFDFEQFNIIAEWDVEMHLKSVLGDDIDSENIVEVIDYFFDLDDD